MAWITFGAVLLCYFTGTTARIIYHDKLENVYTSGCRAGWTQGPNDICYKKENDYPLLSWFTANENCCFDNGSYIIMPKTDADRDFIMQLWKKDYRSFNPQISLYVGVDGMAGYWAWLDNSTFDSSLWCEGVDTTISSRAEDNCVRMRYVDNKEFNPNTKFCFDRINCDGNDDYELFGSICEEIDKKPGPFCPSGWLGRPETAKGKVECYYVSNEKEKTNWQKAFCHCYDKRAMLADIKTWEEAAWLAGKLVSHQLEGSGVMTEVLMGVTALSPFSGWHWIDGEPLQNYTAYFWVNGHVPRPPVVGQDWNRCAAMTWIGDMIMHPRLLEYDCDFGETLYACKMTEDTAKGIFPPTVQALHEKYCKS